MGVVEVLKINPKMVQWDGSIGEGVELTVNSKVALGDAYIGCSIAVNGVCLTAISFDDKQVRSSVHMCFLDEKVICFFKDSRKWKKYATYIHEKFRSDYLFHLGSHFTYKDV